MPAGIKHPLWWKPNGRHKHTVNNTFEKISNSKPSVRSRRLTSFHRFGKPKGAANRRAARKAICEKSFDFLNFAAYNKKHRRCLLVTSTPCGGNPTVATNIQSTIRLRKSQTVSRLFGADGLLLFIPEHIENLNENPENRNEPENFLKYMYHLPEIESPRVIPSSFRYSREVRRPSFTVSCLQFESWKALGFHSSCYTKFAAISQRIALYFEVFREILQRYKRGRHPHDDALLFSRQARSSHPLFSHHRSASIPRSSSLKTGRH